MHWLALIGLFLLASVAYAAWRGAPWVPTWRRDLDRLAGLAALKPGEHFVELGCGDARVCVEMARRSGARATGVELGLPQWAAARLRAWHSRLPVQIALGDAFSFPLADADVAYLFLMPDALAKLAPKLAAELRPGARVVSYVWPVPGMQVVREDHVEGSPVIFLQVKKLET
ncbi:class I SAM-dependent methyltransferase [Patescibacteria group bacterium]|nr:MAG: class I SAM-dependent methyltransferase [Patescibacteria group bacterium]